MEDCFVSSLGKSWGINEVNKQLQCGTVESNSMYLASSIPLLVDAEPKTGVPVFNAIKHTCQN